MKCMTRSFENYFSQKPQTGRPSMIKSWEELMKIVLNWPSFISFEFTLCAEFLNASYLMQ